MFTTTIALVHPEDEGGRKGKDTEDLLANSCYEYNCSLESKSILSNKFMYQYLYINQVDDRKVIHIDTNITKLLKEINTLAKII